MRRNVGAKLGEECGDGHFVNSTGSLIVVESSKLAEVWAFVSLDPYVTEGVFNHVEVKPFAQVFPAA